MCYPTDVSGKLCNDHPVVVIGRLTRFLIKQTNTPESGPILYAAISAGSSENSILINDGINGTLKLSIIRIADTADKIPVTAKKRILERLLFLLFILYPFFPFHQKKKPDFEVKSGKIRAKAQVDIFPCHSCSALFSFLIRTFKTNSVKTTQICFTVGIGFSPIQPFQKARGLIYRSYSPPVWNFTNPQRNL